MGNYTDQGMALWTNTQSGYGVMGKYADQGMDGPGAVPGPARFSLSIRLFYFLFTISKSCFKNHIVRYVL